MDHSYFFVEILKTSGQKCFNFKFSVIVCTFEIIFVS